MVPKYPEISWSEARAGDWVYVAGIWRYVAEVRTDEDGYLQVKLITGGRGEGVWQAARRMRPFTRRQVTCPL